MRRSSLLRVGAVVVLAVLAAVGFFLWIPQHQPDARRLAPLVLARPASIAGRASGRLEPASASDLAPVKSSAAATPGETGVYIVTWSGRGADTGSSVEVTVLPTRATARQAERAAVRADLAQGSLTTKGFGYAGKLHVAGVPGAAGAAFITGTSPTITTGVPHDDAAVFRVARTVVVVHAESTTGAKASSALQVLAAAEHTHLAQLGGAPSIGETTVPGLAALVYALVAAAVLGAAAAAPAAVAAVGRRRRAAYEEALRRERASRGRKVVKRRGAPAPAGRGRR